MTISLKPKNNITTNIKYSSNEENIKELKTTVDQLWNLVTELKNDIKDLKKQVEDLS